MTFGFFGSTASAPMSLIPVGALSGEVRWPFITRLSLTSVQVGETWFHVPGVERQTPPLALPRNRAGWLPPVTSGEKANEVTRPVTAACPSPCGAGPRADQSGPAGAKRFSKASRFRIVRFLYPRLLLLFPNWLSPRIPFCHRSSRHAGSHSNLSPIRRNSNAAVPPVQLPEVSLLAILELLGFVFPRMMLSSEQEMRSRSFHALSPVLRCQAKTYPR